MIARLKVNDIIVHRVYGRARLQAIYWDAPDSTNGVQCQIREIGSRPPRRVWLHDCEKEPKPLPKPALHLVK